MFRSLLVVFRRCKIKNLFASLFFFLFKIVVRDAQTFALIYINFKGEK